MVHGFDLAVVPGLAAVAVERDIVAAHVARGLDLQDGGRRASWFRRLVGRRERIAVRCSMKVSLVTQGTRASLISSAGRGQKLPAEQLQVKCGCAPGCASPVAVAADAERKQWKTKSLMAALLAAAAGVCHGAMGLLQLPATEQDGPVTLCYPAAGSEQAVQRGPFSLNVVDRGVPLPGNGRLVVISHGSGAAPWVRADLARSLVAAGFVVAMPEHRGDNVRDAGSPGPESWAQRPAEVSRAIDAVARDARFAPLLQLDRVGVHGMSAGGHTALTMAGGRWSPGLFKRHCEDHLAADFQSCVGLFTRLTGGALDGLKLWLARAVIGLRFDDDTWQQHQDPRVPAVVAGVPFSADFDMASLAQPRVPLGLVLAQQDRWLIPRFHGDRVRAVCKPCELIADLPTAGHGALLSPPPPALSGLVGELLNDPPGFDRGQMAAVHDQIAAFFGRHLPPAERPQSKVPTGVSPKNTAGALASINPSVAPATTC